MQEMGEKLVYPVKKGNDSGSFTLVPLTAWGGELVSYQHLSPHEGSDQLLWQKRVDWTTRGSSLQGRRGAVNAGEGLAKEMESEKSDFGLAMQG